MCCCYSMTVDIDIFTLVPTDRETKEEIRRQ